MQSRPNGLEKFQVLDCSTHPCVFSGVVNIYYDRAQETTQHIQSTRELHSLAFIWLSRLGHSLEFGGSGNNLAPLSLILKDTQKAVAWLAIRREALPPYRDMAEMPEDKAAGFRWRRQRDKRLGIVLQPLRSARVASPSAALEVAVSYAMASVGEAYLRNWQVDSSETDVEFEQVSWTLLGCFYRRRNISEVGQSDNSCLDQDTEVSLGESFVVDYSLTK